MAGVAERIQFAVCDFAATDLPAAGGVIMLNPAYGDRMGDAVELEPVYKQIGDFFKQRGQGYIGYVFTGNLDLAKRVGLRTRRRIIFFNSEIECRLLEFELYTGTRRTFGGPADPDQAKGA
jgi:putative N6-adenine-specific DNA methylase